MEMVMVMMTMPIQKHTIWYFSSNMSRNCLFVISTNKFYYIETRIKRRKKRKNKRKALRQIESNSKTNWNEQKKQFVRHVLSILMMVFLFLVFFFCCMHIQKRSGAKAREKERKKSHWTRNRVYADFGAIKLNCSTHTKNRVQILIKGTWDTILKIECW